jgi:excisionase family DNA binding protein
VSRVVQGELMESKKYSVDEVANKLSVHVKTIRRYIYSGKISANKIGGQWRIDQSQLDEFMNKSSNEEVCKSCDDSIAKDDFCIFMDTDYFSSEDKIQICSIVDYYAESLEEITNMSQVIMKVVTEEGVNGDKAQFNYVYDESLNRARFVLWGTPSFISKASSLLVQFEGGENDQ